MASPPEFVSLLIDKSILPYNDLGISPGYGRKLLYPDDLPGVLALPWALGPSVPRVNRAQDDGSLNVFVTGQSGGGGGGPTTYKPSSADGPSGVRLVSFEVLPIIAEVAWTSVMLFIQVAALPDIGQSPTEQFGFVTVSLDGATSGKSLGIGAIPIMNVPSGNVGLIAGQLLLAPPGGIDVRSYFQAGETVNLNGTVEGANASTAQASGTIWYQ